MVIDAYAHVFPMRLIEAVAEGEGWPLDELRTIKTMDMDEKDRAKVLYSSAQALLKLPTPAAKLT